MLVYVLNIEGKPLMPCKPAKARHLLREGKAKVLKREPFTIQLLFECDNAVQDVNLGIDAGSKHIGLSVTTKDKVLYEADVELRTDIVDNLATRKQNRRTRRSHKTRYRKPRFNNRVKEDGWLAPSIQQKIGTHLKVVEEIYKILPITKIILETASFDIQKINNPELQGEEYQEGLQLDFWNVREYVMFRDNHECQCCHKKNKVLNVHHIESRKTGGDAPNNLIALCEECHKAYHQGKIKLPKAIHRGMSFRDASFMGVMRWAFYNKLKEIYPNVSMTYGYITKNTRIENNLPKEHYVDARCISGNPLAKPLDYFFYCKKVRCHNRQIHKNTILKGGIRKLNQAPKYVFGYQLFDKVKYNGVECFVFGRRSSGSFDIRKLDGTKISAGTNYKSLQLIQQRKNILFERREAVPPTTEVIGFPA